MNEIPHIEKWLFETLNEDAQLISAGVIGTDAYRTPSKATFPRVQFAFISGPDTNGNGNKRLLTRALYKVVVIAKGNLSSAIVSIADRIDEILQNKTNETFEGYAFSAIREQPLSLMEPGAEAESYFRHVGGLYRIHCYKL